MSEIKVVLLDGSEIKLKKGATLHDAAAKISKKLGKEAIAGIVNGVEKDLNYILEDNNRVEIITFASPEGRNLSSQQFPYYGSGGEGIISPGKISHWTSH